MWVGALGRPGFRAVRLGPEALNAVRRALARIGLVRVSDRVLDLAGTLSPLDLRSLDAIHLATARRLGSDLGDFITYDGRLGAAAMTMGFRLASPA